MKSACSCLAVLPALGQFADYDTNLVLLQRHAEAKITASGGNEWHFCGVEVSNNLGGLGPDVGAPQELRYKRVLKLPHTGRELDLVVTNTTEYSVKDVSKNGESACFGRINIESPGSLTMQFKLVATGTDDFVNDLAHDFTVLDMDHSKAGMMESITTSGFIGTPLSVITPVLAADGVSYTFEGLERSTAIKDPTSPWDLTQPQKDASVGFTFSGRDSWEVTFNTWDETGLLKGGGRNFLFTGRTSLQNTPWPQYGEDNSKCVSLGDEFSEPISQIECQTRAARAGHDYYQYTTEAGGQCATTPTCDKPTTGTGYDWKIFKKAATTSAATPDDVEGVVKPYGSCNADSRSPTTAGMTCLKSADKIDLKCSNGKCVGGAGKNAKCRSGKFTGKTHKGEFVCKSGLRCAGYIDGKQWGKCVN